MSWNDEEWEMAYWSEHARWMEPAVSYCVLCNLSFPEYQKLGNPIIVNATKNGNPYEECKSMKDVDLVSRVIYAEICNVPPKDDNSVSVA